VAQLTAGAPPAGSLQFERADRDSTMSGLTCAVCSKAVSTSYYEVNGGLTCKPCRGQIMAAWNRGSPAGRFARALGLGFGAAMLGAGLYFGIAALTGYEFGLVAVVVGLLVGGAVRKGSNGRGGWRYQALAMFLTYTAVAVTDSSMIARQMSHEMRAKADSAQLPHAGSPTTGVAAGLSAPADSPLGHPNMAGAVALAIGLGLLFALAYAAPIMIGITTPLHLLIAGFALYEAWKLNRGVALRITGPYHASAPTAGRVS
jgi:hypothetical protein